MTLRVIISCPGGRPGRFCSGADELVVVDAGGGGCGCASSLIPLASTPYRRSVVVEAVYNVSVADEVVVTGECSWAVPVTLAVLALLYGARLYIDGKVCGGVGRLLLSKSRPLTELLHPGEASNQR